MLCLKIQCDLDSDLAYLIKKVCALTHCKGFLQYKRQLIFNNHIVSVYASEIISSWFRRTRRDCKESYKVDFISVCLLKKYQTQAGQQNGCLMNENSIFYWHSVSKHKERMGREGGKRRRKYRINASRKKSQNSRPGTIYRYRPDVNYRYVIDSSGDALI